MHAHSFSTFIAIHSALQSSCEKARFEPFHPFAQCLSAPQSHLTRRKGANDAFRAFLAAPFPQAASKRMWPHSFFAFLRCIPASNVVEKGRFAPFKPFAQCLSTPLSHPTGRKARAPECGLIHSLHSEETLLTPSDASFTRSWTERLNSEPSRAVLTLRGVLRECPASRVRAVT